MQEAMKKNLDRIWAGRDKSIPIKTKEELVILASIIQKETGDIQEKGKVAGVFVNRLRRPMRLQSDPTIIYGITQGKKELGRGLRRSEIRGDTPYNTYTNDGLTPTPICNPSLAALEAAANPEENNYLYFVANGKGGHNFSKTLSQHNKYVKEWRKIERERKQN